MKRLAKRYPSLKTDVIKLVNSLSADPTQGIPLGQNCFKIRLAIKSKGKGKSGGARVITFVVVLSETVVLLSIYDKSDKENISSEELADLLQSL
ncbi:type II toxin-antitoxin system RelE/ParE family toxin [Dyadobacter sp. CY261]|nr:type II toxin-antitoxin system RelE/ParE family toxin [Dyadobacter sp. CY261]